MGLIASVASFTLVFVSIPLSYALHRWRQGENAEPFDQFLGSKTSYFALASIAALWLMPYGLIILIPLMFILSFSSPAGRIDWKDYRDE